MEKPATSSPDPALTSRNQAGESTLLPMLIAGLVLVTIGLVVIMAFY